MRRWVLPTSKSPSYSTTLTLSSLLTPLRMVQSPTRPVQRNAGIMRIRVADAVTTDASVLECECGSEDAIVGGD